MSRSKKKTIPFQVRQGDVFLERLPDGARTGLPLQKGETRIVLAWGESTHHAHIVDRRQAELYDKPDTTAVGDAVWERLLRVLDKGELQHDCPGQSQPDHNPIPLPPGDYEVVQQVVYTPAEIRNVAD